MDDFIEQRLFTVVVREEGGGGGSSNRDAAYRIMVDDVVEGKVRYAFPQTTVNGSSSSGVAV